MNEWMNEWMNNNNNNNNNNGTYIAQIRKVQQMR